MARNIEKLNINAFRGIENLMLENFGDINIIVGANNSGKTSVLEAIKLMQYPYDIGSMVKISFSRAGRVNSKNFVNFFASMFKKDLLQDIDVNSKKGSSEYTVKLNMQIENKIIGIDVVGEIIEILNIDENKNPMNSTKNNDITDKVFNGSIKVKDDKVYYREFKIESTSRPEVDTGIEKYTGIYMGSQVQYYASCVQWLSEAVKEDYLSKKEDFISVLKIFDKNIKDISVIESDIYIHSKKTGSMPLFSYGTGMQKALLLAAVVVQSKNGIILVDEIENAIHISALKEVFKWFIEACKSMNVQAFITTHSLEAVDAILETQYDKENEIYDKNNKNILRIITLRKDEKNNITRARNLTGKEAFEDRESYGLEVRI